MTRFVAGAGLNARVAAEFGVPKVRELADLLANRVRANVPNAGVWMTAQDERVRPSHKATDGQTIPDNLRYILPTPNSEDWDVDDPGSYEMARVPRDPDLSLANRYACRCEALPIEGLIAEHVSASDAVPVGMQAQARVAVAFHRIVESEHPGPEDRGGGWLRRSVEEVLAGQVR